MSAPLAMFAVVVIATAGMNDGSADVRVACSVLTAPDESVFPGSLFRGFNPGGGD